MTLKLKEEHGENLAVVLVESQGHSPDEVEQFAYQKKWLGSNAMWTSERPVESGSRGLPAFVLLDTDGRRILEGNSNAMKSQIEDAIQAEIDKARRGPEDVAKDLRDPAKDLLRRQYADAITAAEKVAQSAGDDAELATEAGALAAEAKRRAESQLARVGRLIDAGNYLRADEFLEVLEKSCEGHDALEQATADLRKRLDSDELEGERDAAKALAKLERVIADKGLDAVHKRQLDKIVERHAGTKAAQRAAHLASLVGE